MDAAVNLAKQSDSTIIILIVVIAVIIIALSPVMKTIASIDSVKRKQDYEREGRLIQVIEKNTEVNSALKTLIEADQKHCDECRQDQLHLFSKVFDNQEITNMKLVEISTTLGISNKEGEQ